MSLFNLNDFCVEIQWAGVDLPNHVLTSMLPKYVTIQSNCYFRKNIYLRDEEQVVFPRNGYWLYTFEKKPSVYISRGKKRSERSQWISRGYAVMIVAPHSYFKCTDSNNHMYYWRQTNEMTNLKKNPIDCEDILIQLQSYFDQKDIPVVLTVNYIKSKYCARICIIPSPQIILWPVHDSENFFFYHDSLGAGSYMLHFTLSGIRVFLDLQLPSGTKPFFTYKMNKNKKKQIVWESLCRKQELLSLPQMIKYHDFNYHKQRNAQDVQDRHLTALVGLRCRYPNVSDCPRKMEQPKSNKQFHEIYRFASKLNSNDKKWHMLADTLLKTPEMLCKEIPGSSIYHPVQYIPASNIKKVWTSTCSFARRIFIMLELNDNRCICFYKCIMSIFLRCDEFVTQLYSFGFDTNQRSIDFSPSGVFEGGHNIQARLPIQVHLNPNGEYFSKYEKESQ